MRRVTTAKNKYTHLLNASSDDWDGLKCKLWEVLRFCDIPNCARDYLYEVQPFRERLPSVELRIPTREKHTVRSQNKRRLDGFTRQAVIYSNQQKLGGGAYGRTKL